jgi:hypothetical protein
VNGTSTLNIGESLTLDGAALTRANGADLNLAAGKTLLVQNGGDAAITGAYANTTASTITVTGAGSSFTEIPRWPSTAAARSTCSRAARSRGPP